MPKVNMESLLPFIEEAFTRGLDFQIPITGTSMNPLLYQNRDFVKIQKPALPLEKGDIPLYRRKDGAFVLHRVVDIKENGEYVMCGDNQFVLEYGITDANIIGIAKKLIINGNEIDVDNDALYLKHKEKYLKNVRSRYPARRLRYKLALAKRRIFNCGMRNVECGIEPEKNQVNIDKTQDIINIGSILINAIKAQITDSEYQFPEATDFKKLYMLAHNHRVTAMVAPLVMKCEFADKEIKGIFSKELFKYSARYTAQDKERAELSEILSENEIKHCFLKGSKVGRYYDNPDIRFMLDMDLYVEKDKIKKAEELLVSRGYEKNSNGDDKDTAFIKKPFLIIELHKEIKYDYDKGYDYYKGAFERMISDNGYAMNMSNEDFYVYILSHSAHHFEIGGTGIKSIVDHYYLRKKLKPKCDALTLENALENIGLTRFNQRIDKLCDFWFEDSEGDSFAQKTAEYVIFSGVFGNEMNNYLSGVAKGRYEENSNSYLFRRLFPSMKIISIRYPILKKLPILLPIFWCVRILSAFFDRNRISQETKTVFSVDSSQKQEQKDFLDDMGL